jgi:FtsH-binding integral membrane protein
LVKESKGWAMSARDSRSEAQGNTAAPTLAAAILRGLGWIALVSELAFLVWLLATTTLVATFWFFVFTGLPVVALGATLVSYAGYLLRGGGHLGAFLLLALVFSVAWVFAWESQMYEPSWTVDVNTPKHAFLIGIRPPASWNLGRVVAATVALAALVGLASLMRPTRMRDHRGAVRGALIAGAAGLLVATIVSVPVLRDRERDRWQQAHDACVDVYTSQGLAPQRIQDLCRNPYDEPFIEIG